MAINAVVQQVDEVLARAHGLFGDPPNSGASAAVGAGAHLAGAGQLVGSGKQQMSGLSGQLATDYGVFAGVASSALHTLAGSDDQLASHLEQAADADRAGRAASKAVIDAAAADVAALASVSNTPAGENALLTALRTRVAQQQTIVDDVKARDAEMAAHLRTLPYRSHQGTIGPDGEVLGDLDPHSPAVRPVDNPQGANGISGVVPAPAGRQPPVGGRVQAVDFKLDGPQPSPGPQPFLPQYEQALTAPPATKPGGPPLPLAPPPPNPPESAPAPPVSAACQSAIDEQRQEVIKKLLRDMGKGAVLGGAAGVTVDGVGAIPGLISGAAIGGIGSVIDWATTPHPPPPECK